MQGLTVCLTRMWTQKEMTANALLHFLCAAASQSQELQPIELYMYVCLSECQIQQHHAHSVFCLSECTPAQSRPSCLLRPTWIYNNLPACNDDLPGYDDDVPGCVVVAHSVHTDNDRRPNVLQHTRRAATPTCTHTYTRTYTETFRGTQERTEGQ